MKMFLSIFILLFQIGTIFTHSHHTIHEHMTPGEVQDVFGTTHENIPDYEIVPVSHGFYRDSNGKLTVRLTSFEEDITLYLEPTDGALAGSKTPIYRAQLDNNTLEQKVVFKKVSNAVKSSHKIFQDPENLAALLIQFGKDGMALLNGIIDKLAIRPLPQRFRGQFKREKRSVDNEHSNLEDTHHHIVYKIDSSPIVDGQNRPVSRAQPNLRQSKTTNVVPPVIHPQVLIVMDSNLFNKFGQDADKAVEYLLSFWNGVDLRYRVFRDPEVRVNIAGIILAEDEGVTSFLTINRIEIDGQEHNKISVDNALRSMSKFFYPYTSYNEEDNSLTFKELDFHYDVAVAMTTYDMCQFAPRCLDSNKFICSPRPKLIRDSCITLGLAYYTGACSYDSNESLMESVSIIEDKGGFAGIIPAAHELGHLLGASHHANNEHKCPVDDSYIMSYKLVVTEYSFVWSNCSLYSIKKFIENKPRAQCLFNKPVTDKEIKRVLPGTLYSRDEMCQQIMGTNSCTEKKYSESCVKLYCKQQNDETCIHAPYSAIPEGAPCGTGKRCINAHCLRKSERKVLIKVGTATTETPVEA